MRRALRYCTAPHCGTLVDGGGRCPVHARAQDRQRPGATARGYDAEWAALSRRWLALHRWCGERADFKLHTEHSQCAQDGRRTRATATDHIRALRAGGARLEPSNLQSLCGACNSRKAIALEGTFAHPR